MAAQQSRKLPQLRRTGVRFPAPPPISLGCSWESRRIPNPPHGVRILTRVPRRARQMVSQHIAKVPSARARLGSIPRLSAKLVSKKVRVSGGYGWPRLPVEQRAPSEHPGSNPGTPTKDRPLNHTPAAKRHLHSNRPFKSKMGSDRCYEAASPPDHACLYCAPRGRRSECSPAAGI